MALVLVRVDDRLIHGQVVEGWLRVIQAGRIVVVSDQAAGDPLQVSLMRLAVPPEVQVMVLRVQEAASALNAGEWPQERVLLLLPGLREVSLLVEAGVSFESINLGGLHDAPGRSSLTASLALSPEERQELRRLLDRKIRIETRALPTDEILSVEVFL